MRVLFTKGRLEPISQKRILDAAPALRRGRKPTYFYSSIYSDLVPACKERGWNVETFFVGSTTRQRLHRPDVIVNMISEPLLCERALKRLDEFIQKNPIPVMNSVEATRRSSRLSLGKVLLNLDTETEYRVHTPLTTRFTGEFGALVNHIEVEGHNWPVIIRPPGIHGGRGMKRVESPDDLDDDPSRPIDTLITDLVDYRSSEGIFEKTRFIWAGGKVFRRHRIYADQWNIGGEARLYMLDRPNLIEAEKAFLFSENSELEQTVALLFQTIGLNFGLLDCSVSEDKRLTVFELNGSFQIGSSIPEEKQHVWGYLEDSNRPILEALLLGIESRGMN